MKIAIVAPSPVPFLIGGAEKFWGGLQYHLNELTPHVVELIKIPCRDSDFWGLIDGYEQFSRLDLSFYDMVVSSKYPAWMVAHPNHHCYMQHTCRGVYDLYRGPTGVEALPDHPAFDRLLRLLLEGPAERSLLAPIFTELWRLRDRGLIDAGRLDLNTPLVRALIHRLDRIGLAPERIQRYSAISRTVADRADYLPAGVPVVINHHPSDLSGLHSSSYSTIFTASRLAELKRIDLLIRAFRQVDAEIEFRIAGTGSHEPELRALAGDDPRITFLGFVPNARLVDEYAKALFVPFVPYDEDYGLITVEAMQAGKAVLTTHDAGGVRELVEDGRTGLVVAPEVAALAAAMTRLLADRAETVQMGLAGQDRAAAINWRHTVSLLLGEEPPPQWRRRRPRLLALSTSPAYPPRGGGQYRTLHLCRELARDAEVTILSLGPVQEPPATTEICPGLREIRIPRSAGQYAQALALRQRLGVSADDLANIDDWRENPDFSQAVARELAAAELVLTINPYLYGAVRELGFKGRLWYDAHDVALDIKRAMLPPGAESTALLARVEEMERACVTEAEQLFTCSEHDAQRLAELYGRPLADFRVVANGADVGAARPFSPWERQQAKQRLGLGAAPLLLFMGSWHAPNVEALPLLASCARLAPAATIVITGSLCEHPEAQGLPENIKLFGVLDEEAKCRVLAAADLALNPVVSGSGTNLKMLEYAAWEIPILSTPYGNRGLAFVAGEHLTLAASAEFPATLARLAVTLPPDLAAMAKRARAVVRLCYDWPVIAAPMRELLARES